MPEYNDDRALTDEKLDAIRHEFGLSSRLDKHDFRDVARVIEQAAIKAYAQAAVDAERARGAVRSMALEEAAAVCEAMRDLKEHARAHKAAGEALSHGDDAEALHRLRHHNSVSLFNGALERAAKAIRALGQQDQQPKDEA